MRYLTPFVGDTGQFITSEPFDKIVLKEQTYTCIAIKSLADIVAFNQRPFEDYWEPYGISRSTYDEHAYNKVNIIVLKEATGKIISIPNSYIKSIPFAGGVEYANMVLGVDLGVIGVNTDFSLLTKDIEAIVKKHIGLNSVNIKPIRVTSSIRKTEEEDNRIRKARNNHINETFDTESELIKANKTIEKLKADLIALSKKQ